MIVCCALVSLFAFLYHLLYYGRCLLSPHSAIYKWCVVIGWKCWELGTELREVGVQEYRLYPSGALGRETMNLYFYIATHAVPKVPSCHVGRSTYFLRGSAELKLGRGRATGQLAY